MTNTKVKICGLKRIEDVEYINELKPDFCGFIINFPRSHRSLIPEELEELTAKVDAEIPRVGVFVNQPTELVISLLQKGVVDLVQLHGTESEEEILRIQEQTGKPVCKAFKILQKEDLQKALHSSADYILLDQGYGEGKAFDWKLIDEDTKQALRERKWFLAGGLGEDNIQQAIAELQPYGVDLSSSVETNQCKDYEKIKKIISLVKD